MQTAQPLSLDGYRHSVGLDRPFQPAAAPASVGEFADLVAEILAGLGAAGHPGGGRDLLRALLTVRPPGPLPSGVAPLLDALLGGERARRPAVDVRALPTVAEQFPSGGYPAAAATVLWRGDLTVLRADAVVNAANSGLLGCFQPTHRCVDNVIHAAAGPRLRADCHTIVTAQGGPEPTGTAKITRGYHLPARYVLHTVGPAVRGPLTRDHRRELASAYRSCLDLAAAIDGVRSIAFCSISTGLFGFPREPAARIALTTIAAWLAEHPGRLDRVVIDVFTPDDLAVHRRILTDWNVQ